MSSGSYPERDGNAVFHTVALAAPMARSSPATAPRISRPDGAWAKAGDQFVIAPTPLGRIALCSARNSPCRRCSACIPPNAPTSSRRRPDYGQALMLETDPKLFNKPYPPGTPFAPWAAAALGQFWVAAAGWQQISNRPHGCSAPIR